MADLGIQLFLMFYIQLVSESLYSKKGTNYLWSLVSQRIFQKAAINKIKQIDYSFFLVVKNDKLQKP